MGKFYRSEYKVLNPEKYVGQKLPICRSSWERTFCRFCDTNDNVLQWISEGIQIPYINPLKRRGSIYIPDFVIVYKNNKGQKITEMIEIKPSKEVTLTEKTSRRDKLMIAVNHAKWKAAVTYCRHRNIQFRIVTEKEMFWQGQK